MTFVPFFICSTSLPTRPDLLELTEFSDEGCSDLENSSIDTSVAAVHTDLRSCRMYLGMIKLSSEFLEQLKTVNHTARHTEEW